MRFKHSIKAIFVALFISPVLSISFCINGDINLAFAKDLGTYGHSYEVKEEGFIAMVVRRLKLLDLNQEEQKMREIATKAANEPKPLDGVRRTVKAKSFIHDPSYILQENIFMPNGKLLYPAGIRVNPLDYINLEKKLIFIDARDKAQVKWFKDNYSSLHQNQLQAEQDKLILTGGSPHDLETELGRSVYFDQSGMLTGKFSIRQVPAIVEQEGKVLKISEVSIDD